MCIRDRGLTHYYEIGQMGIEHALLPEKGITVAGECIIGADSHTCTYGCLLYTSWRASRPFDTRSENQTRPSSKYPFIQSPTVKVIKNTKAIMKRKIGRPRKRLVNKSQKAERTERVDRIMTSRFLGLPIFIFIMAFVFFITFTVGDWMNG